MILYKESLWRRSINGDMQLLLRLPFEYQSEPISPSSSLPPPPPPMNVESPELVGAIESAKGCGTELGGGTFWSWTEEGAG